MGLSQGTGEDDCVTKRLRTSLSSLPLLPIVVRHSNPAGVIFRTPNTECLLAASFTYICSCG